ncbi:hypothetical protein CP983_39235 [Streptomyces chartreusis]|nr:hypothetical protein CP983_39235 [Streptomyces chartreusis]
MSQFVRLVQEQHPVLAVDSRYTAAARSRMRWVVVIVVQYPSCTGRGDCKCDRDQVAAILAEFAAGAACCIQVPRTRLWLGAWSLIPNQET